MVVSGSPKRWDRWHSPSPNWQHIPLGSIYHLYTPETTIDQTGGEIHGDESHGPRIRFKKSTNFNESKSIYLSRDKDGCTPNRILGIITHRYPLYIYRYIGLISRDFLLNGYVGIGVHPCLSPEKITGEAVGETMSLDLSLQLLRGSLNHGIMMFS